MEKFSKLADRWLNGMFFILITPIIICLIAIFAIITFPLWFPVKVDEWVEEYLKNYRREIKKVKYQK